MLQKAKRPGLKTPTGDVLLAGERPGTNSPIDPWSQVLATRYRISNDMPRSCSGPFVEVVAMTDAHRIRSTAALLASDKDGEALGAARALCRLLGKHGLEPADVVGAGLSLSTTTRVRPEPVAPWSPWDMRSDPLRPWRNKARTIAAHRETLSARELEFALNMVARREQPTPKQQEWLDCLADRTAARWAA